MKQTLYKLVAGTGLALALTGCGERQYDEERVEETTGVIAPVQQPEVEKINLGDLLKNLSSEERSKALTNLLEVGKLDDKTLVIEAFNSLPAIQKFDKKVFERDYYHDWHTSETREWYHNRFIPDLIQLGEAIPSNDARVAFFDTARKFFEPKYNSEQLARTLKEVITSDSPTKEAPKGITRFVDKGQIVGYLDSNKITRMLYEVAVFYEKSGNQQKATELYNIILDFGLKQIGGDSKFFIPLAEKAKHKEAQRFFYRIAMEEAGKDEKYGKAQHFAEKLGDASKARTYEALGRMLKTQ